MNVFRALGHDDPLFSLQPAAREWQLDELHAAATGRDVRVAVIDSGVQLDHPDLAGQVMASANFVGDPDARAEIHGTAVAGIIAARADNHVGIAGVAPRARLLALARLLAAARRRDTSCTTPEPGTALHAAIERGAQVINLSLGGPPDRLIERLRRGGAGARHRRRRCRRPRAAASGGFPAGVRRRRRRRRRDVAARRRAGHGRGTRHRHSDDPARFALGHGVGRVVRGGACQRPARADARAQASANAAARTGRARRS